jgi:glycosyltransferase involved in cell wall biosynthesis
MLETGLEKRTLSTCAGFVTVSEPLAETLVRKFGRPVATIPNGFDPDDYGLPLRHSFNLDELNLVYTGTIYHGKQDIDPLFEAMRRVESFCPVHLYMCGRGVHRISEAAENAGVRHRVSFLGERPYREALALQRQADGLLLLLWNDPRQKGVFTGKLFEYLGARRRILAVGRTDNVAAELIETRKAGKVAETPENIAAYLCELWEMKRASKEIADLPAGIGEGFSRITQVEKLNAFLESITSK